MFSRKFREIFKNKFFYRTPPAAASGSVKMETQASRNTQNKTYSKSKGQNMSQNMSQIRQVFLWKKT